MSNLSKRREAGAGHADPLNNNAPGKAPSGYPKTSDPATVTEFPRDRKILRSTAARRQAELIRLFRGRRALGLRIDPHMAVWTLAATLGSASAGPYPIPKRQRCLRWYGLTLESLRIAVDRSEMGEFSDDELLTIIRDIERGVAAHGPRLIRAEKLGDLLQVTAAEREEFSLRTIEACDESPEDRKARQAETRRQKNRERMRAIRGCAPREIFEENSLAKMQPWEDEGCSRATYFRRKRKELDGETRLCTHVLSLKGACTDLSHAVALAGPARSDAAILSGSAGGHSPGGKTKTRTPGRNGGDAAFDDAAPSGRPSENPSEAKKKPQPKDSPLMPDATAVITAIREAEGVLQAQRGQMRGKARDRLDEVLSLLPGVRMILEWDADIPDHVAACAEGSILYLRRFANDNRIAGIIQRLAA